MLEFFPGDLISHFHIFNKPQNYSDIPSSTPPLDTALVSENAENRNFGLGFHHRFKKGVKHCSWTSPTSSTYFKLSYPIQPQEEPHLTEASRASGQASNHKGPVALCKAREIQGIQCLRKGKWISAPAAGRKGRGEGQQSFVFHRVLLSKIKFYFHFLYFIAGTPRTARQL